MEPRYRAPWSVHGHILGVCRANTVLTGLLNSAPAPFYRGYDDPWLHQGKHSSQRLHRTPLQKRSQVMLKSFEVPQIRAYDWWALALSVPGQSKRFLVCQSQLLSQHSLSMAFSPCLPLSWRTCAVCILSATLVVFTVDPAIVIAGSDSRVRHSMLNCLEVCSSEQPTQSSLSSQDMGRTQADSLSGCNMSGS